MGEATISDWEVAISSSPPKIFSEALEVQTRDDVAKANLVDLARRCCTRDPLARPSAAALLSEVERLV